MTKTYAFKQKTAILFACTFLSSATIAHAQQTNFDHVKGIQVNESAYKHGMSEAEAAAHMEQMRERYAQKMEAMQMRHDTAMDNMQAKQERVEQRIDARDAMLDQRMEQREAYQDQRKEMKEDFMERRAEMKDERQQFRQEQRSEFEQRRDVMKERRAEYKEDRQNGFVERKEAMQQRAMERRDMRQQHQGDFRGGHEKGSNHMPQMHRKGTDQQAMPDQRFQDKKMPPHANQQKDMRSMQHDGQPQGYANGQRIAPGLKKNQDPRLMGHEQAHTTQQRGQYERKQPQQGYRADNRQVGKPNAQHNRVERASQKNAHPSKGNKQQKQ